MSNPAKQSISVLLSKRRYRPWHWGLTILYLLLLLASLPVAMRALILAPAEGVSEGLFFAMTLAVAAVPFTIMVCLVASWMYHRGGAQRAAFIPYAIPVLNVLIALALRAML